MYELCPLCLKKGANSRIKAIHINFEEAMWKCESEECLWPFIGSDKPTFFRRMVVEKWSWEWEVYKKVNEHVGSIPISTELSLYTPPVTPSVDASTKESAQSETVKNTLELSNKIDGFSRNSSFSDSYAPRPSAETAFSLQENVSTVPEHNSAKLTSMQYEKNSKIVEKMPPSLPSIFDIDGEKYTDKTSVKLRSDSGPTDLLKRDVAIPDKGNSSPTVDCNATILSTFPKSRTEKSSEIREETIGIIKSNDSPAKKLPQVRSIARTNIDLQRLDPASIVKVEKPEALKRLECPAISTKNPKSHENIDGKLLNLNQHTTTITVDGIPPITLSYDLTDLEIQIEKSLPAPNTRRAERPTVPPAAITPPVELPTVPTTTIMPRAGRPTVPPATSTPRIECSPVLSDHNRGEKLSAEMPKKKLRRLAMGRVANNGKSFEKFSFNGLKKVGKSSITTNAPSIVKSESPKLEQIVNNNQSCAYEGGCHFPASVIDTASPAAAAATSEARDLSQRFEPLPLANLDENNLTVTEYPTVDNVNFSNLIDDMLLDYYPNATQDLNDDWLDSLLNDIT